MKNRRPLLLGILLGALSLALILALPWLMNTITGRSLNQSGRPAEADNAPGPPFPIATSMAHQGGVVEQPMEILSMFSADDRLQVLYGQPGGGRLDMSAYARTTMCILTGLDFSETVDGKYKWTHGIQATPYPDGLLFTAYFSEASSEVRMMDPNGGLSTNYQLTLWAGDQADPHPVVDTFSAFDVPIGDTRMQAASLDEPRLNDMDELRKLAKEQGGEQLRDLLDTVALRHEELAGQVIADLRFNGQTFAITNFNTISLTHNRPSNNSASYSEVEIHLDLMDSLGRPFMAIVRVNPDLTADLTGLYITEEEARNRL